MEAAAPTCRKCGSPKLAPSRVRKSDFTCNRCLTDKAVARSQPSRQWLRRKNSQVMRDAAAKRHRRWHLLKQYGLTEADFDRMLAQQDGKCSICGDPAVVVDHCHETDQVRELLCFSCNRGLGDFKENVAAMKKAVEYLERHHAKR